MRDGEEEKTCVCVHFCYWQAHYVNPPPCPSLHSIPGASSFKPLCRLGGKRPTTLATPSMTSVSLLLLYWLFHLSRALTSIPPKKKLGAPNFCFSLQFQGKRWGGIFWDAAHVQSNMLSDFLWYNKTTTTPRKKEGCINFVGGEKSIKMHLKWSRKRRRRQKWRERHWTSR